MAYHVESFLVCDCCHGNRVTMQGCNGRDVLEREAQRRGWDRILLETSETMGSLAGNRCRECKERQVKT